MFTRRVALSVLAVISAPVLWAGTVCGAVGPFNAVPNGDSNPFPISEATAFFDSLHVESEVWRNITGYGDGTWENYYYMGESYPSNLPPWIPSTARRVTAYIQASHVDESRRAEYLQRAQWGLDYLTQQGVQKDDGRFERENNDGTGSTLDDLYDTAIAGRALVEGYREFTDPTYLAAAENAANWHLNATIQGIYSDPNSAHRYGPPLEAAADFDNANFVAFVAWHLASVYEVTDSTKYIDGARRACHYIMDCQDPSDGTWEHYGGTYPDPDKLMRYHCITLRGLLETYHVIKGNPDYSAFQDSLETSITSAINYMIGQQKAAPDPDKKLMEEKDDTTNT